MMISDKKIEKMLYYALQQVHHGSAYVWGGQGEKLKSFTVEKLVNMETSSDNAQRVVNYMYKNRTRIDSLARIFDCSGLICKSLEYAGVVKKGFDSTANELYLKYDKKSISKRERGNLIYKLNQSGIAVHVGIVYDYDYVIEAKGRDVGVVKSKIDNSWNACNVVG